MKYSPIAVLLAILALAACKKDNDTTTLPSLSGLAITRPSAYLASGSQMEIQADILSIVGPDGEKPVIGLYWQLNSGDKDTLKVDGNALMIDLSDPNLETKYKDSPLLRHTLNLEGDGEYTLYCYAFSKGYYSTSDYCRVNAVTPSTVVSGIPGQNPVSLGEQTYWTIDVAGKIWTANNIYDPSAGLSFRDCDVLDRGMGRLYSWTQAQALCPAGWHLPTAAEFKNSFGDADGIILAGDLIVDAKFQDKEMWAYNADVHFSNSYGFNAIPAGYVDTNDQYNTWSHYGHYAFFWTADEHDGLGTYLYLYEKEPQARWAHGDKQTLYMSVRCVKD